MSKSTGEKPSKAIKDSIQQEAKAETVAPSLRRYRTVLFLSVLFLAIIVFVLLAFLARTTPAFPIDLQITRAIQSIDSPIFDGLMRLISWPGFSPQSTIVTLLIALVLYLFGLHWEAVTALLASLLSGLTNQLVKILIQRPRPSVDSVDVFAVLKSYSFPSGHVMFYTILFGFLWYLAYSLLKPSLQRSLLLVLLGGLILGVGISRIYLGQHWASDVLGAHLLGGLMLAGIILFYQWGKTRFFLRQPVAPPDSKKE
jgi:membrane-associated phospholipid phosphatase